MKFKNLLMQWFVMTPLVLLHSICGWMIVSTIVMFVSGSDENVSFLSNSVLFSVLSFGIDYWIARLILKIRGKETSFTYWDSDFEYEVKHEYGDHYSLNKTKGGWTEGTKGIVWLYMIISPIAILLQIIADILAVVSFSNKRIASWYGAINYESFDNPLLQEILHFLLNIVILREGCELGK